MPRPPLIASVSGQRLAVTVVMAALFTVSLAGAFAYTHYRPGAAPRVERVGWYAVTLPGYWRPEPPGPFAQLFGEARLFRDPRQPVRVLALGTHTFDQPVEPARVIEALLPHLAEGQVEVYPIADAAHPQFTGVQLMALQPVEEGVAVQHLVAAIAQPGDARRYAVLYMHDVVPTRSLARNAETFQELQQSLVGTQP